MGAKFDPAVFRILSSANLATSTSGGAQKSTAAFGVQTYAIQLTVTNLNSTAGSVGGARIAVTDSTTGVVSSTADVLIPPNFPMVFKVTPGQRLAAISGDGGLYNLNVVELTN